jgi:phosphoribosylanthranilate isomerase
MKIKICGIKCLEDALLAANLGADAIGFILYKKSKRYITPMETKEIIKCLPPFITKVGVFVNEEVGFINQVVEETGLTSAQLHGDELPDLVDSINVPVIKAFRIGDNFDFSNLQLYKNCYYLLDTFDPNNFGGTGKKFNWDRIPQNLISKIILAGGITLDDLQIIKDEISPYAVDVSSSVEIEPGKKDEAKMRSLFEKLKEIRGN